MATLNYLRDWFGHDPSTLRSATARRGSRKGFSYRPLACRTSEHVVHALRPPGRDRGSRRTEPVKFRAAPRMDGSAPLCVMAIRCWSSALTSDAEAVRACADGSESRKSNADEALLRSCFILSPRVRTDPQISRLTVTAEAASRRRLKPGSTGMAMPMIKKAMNTTPMIGRSAPTESRADISLFMGAQGNG